MIRLSAPLAAAAPVAADPLALDLRPLEWGAVALASAIIFAILGRRLLADIRRWLRPG